MDECKPLMRERTVLHQRRSEPVRHPARLGHRQQPHLRGPAHQHWVLVQHGPRGRRARREARGGGHAAVSERVRRRAPGAGRQRLLYHGRAVQVDPMKPVLKAPLWN